MEKEVKVEYYENIKYLINLLMCEVSYFVL
jgi:hypothetical protein